MASSLLSETRSPMFALSALEAVNAALWHLVSSVLLKARYRVHRRLGGHQQHGVVASYVVYERILLRAL